MSLRLNHSVFIHIPRTSGLWFGEVCKRLKLVKQQFTGDHDSHMPHSQMPPIWKALPSFTFVRDPFSWVKSRWTHSVEHNIWRDFRHTGIHREFSRLMRPTLVETIWTILDVRPGLVGETWQEMIDPTTTLRQVEQQPQAALDMLYWYEKPDDVDSAVWRETVRQAISEVPSFNASSNLPHLQHLTTVPGTLVLKFLDSEGIARQLWERAWLPPNLPIAGRKDTGETNGTESSNSGTGATGQETPRASPENAGIRGGGRLYL